MISPPISVGVEDLFLYPGGFYYGGGPLHLRTTLGSCVAITLWHPRLRTGGMCHYLLPFRNRPPKASLDGAYAQEAMALFLREIERQGCPVSEYEAGIYGGGHMFDVTRFAARFDVANMNVEIGRNLLRQYGFRVSAEHVGGEGHREVVMDLMNGQVQVRQYPLIIT